jgi:hypothetical protein
MYSNNVTMVNLQKRNSKTVMMQSPRHQQPLTNNHKQLRHQQPMGCYQQAAPANNNQPYTMKLNVR